jgi:hypothetical protein
MRISLHHSLDKPNLDVQILLLPSAQFPFRIQFLGHKGGELFPTALLKVKLSTRRYSTSQAVNSTEWAKVAHLRDSRTLSESVFLQPSRMLAPFPERFNLELLALLWDQSAFKTTD